MNDSESPQNVIRDLIVSDRETGGKPQVPTGSRSLLEIETKRILVNRERLNAHFALLRGSGSACHVDSLSGDQMETIITKGLGCLGDQELAILLVSPAALFALHCEIDETTPAPWVEALAADGRALMDAMGCR